LPAGHRLALRVLRAAAGLAAPDFLALHLARIARHEARIAQRLAQRLIESDQRAGDAVTDRARLAGDATAVDRNVDIELAHQLHRLEGLRHDHAPGLATDELIESALMDCDLAAAALEVDTRRGGLAA